MDKSRQEFFEEHVLDEYFLEQLENDTGITPDRAIKICNDFVARAGIDRILTHKRTISRAIFELGLEPDEDDKEEIARDPNIYIGLSDVEKVLAGYLLAWEYIYEAVYMPDKVE